MRRIVRAAAVVGAVLLLAGCVTSRAAAPATLPRYCVPDTGAVERTSLAMMRQFASSSDSATAAARDSLAGMARTPPELVDRVSDEAMCERASRALAAHFFRVGPKGAPHLEPVRLFRVGPRWIVVPRDAHMGEFGYAVHFDAEFRRRLAVSTF